MQQLRVKMGVRYNILRDMQRDKVLANYASKDRLIDAKTYKELKSRKKCSYCHKPFSGCVPEVHHRVPHSKGGTNDASNLMALHPKCHKILDAQEGVRDERSNKT